MSRVRVPAILLAIAVVVLVVGVIMALGGRGDVEDARDELDQMEVDRDIRRGEAEEAEADLEEAKGKLTACADAVEAVLAIDAEAAALEAQLLDLARQGRQVGVTDDVDAYNGIIDRYNAVGTQLDQLYVSYNDALEAIDPALCVP